MKLKTVKILARTYKIIWIDDDHAADSNIQGYHESGWGDYKIKIAKRCKHRMECLIHEIFHSLIFQMHIDDRDFKVENRCAHAVDMLSEQFLGVIRENKINLLEELEP